MSPEHFHVPVHRLETQLVVQTSDHPLMILFDLGFKGGVPLSTDSSTQRSYASVSSHSASLNSWNLSELDQQELQTTWSAKRTAVQCTYLR